MGLKGDDAGAHGQFGSRYEDRKGGVAPILRQQILTTSELVSQGGATCSRGATEHMGWSGVLCRQL